MDFTHMNNGGRKSGRFLMVASMHVALGVMFVHGMNTRHLSFTPPPITEVTPLKEKHVEPPPQQVEPPKPKERPLDKIIVPPPPDTVVDRRLDEPVIHGFKPDGPPTVVDGPKEGPVVPPPPAPKPQGIRTAVLADPNACALPEYPARSLRNGDSGTTTLALLVGTDGRVTSARVEASSGYRELDRAAVDALSLCRFKPASNNGVAEAGWAKLAYVWKLD